VQADHPTVGRSYLYAAAADHLIFTENETNNERLFAHPTARPTSKMPSTATSWKATSPP